MTDCDRKDCAATRAALTAAQDQLAALRSGTHIHAAGCASSPPSTLPCDCGERLSAWHRAAEWEPGHAAPEPSVIAARDEVIAELQSKLDAPEYVSAPVNALSDEPPQVDEPPDSDELPHDSGTHHVLDTGLCLECTIQATRERYKSERAAHEQTKQIARDIADTAKMSEAAHEQTKRELAQEHDAYEGMLQAARALRTERDTLRAERGRGWTVYRSTVEMIAETLGLDFDADIKATDLRGQLDTVQARVATLTKELDALAVVAVDAANAWLGCFTHSEVLDRMTRPFDGSKTTHATRLLKAARALAAAKAETKEG